MDDQDYFIQKYTSMWMQGEVNHKINSLQSRFLKAYKLNSDFQTTWRSSVNCKCGKTSVENLSFEAFTTRFKYSLGQRLFQVNTCLKSTSKVTVLTKINKKICDWCYTYPFNEVNN